MRKKSYPAATVHVSSKPDRLACTGDGLEPPGFSGDTCWVSCDAGFTVVHVAKDPDSISGAALVGVDPIVSCGQARSLTLVTILKGKVMY